MIYFVVTLVTLIVLVTGKVYFKENFDDVAWTDRWTVPFGGNPPVPAQLGKYKHIADEHAGIPLDNGIQIAEALRLYSLSTKLDSAFTNRDKELVIQMSVKNKHPMLCGDAYIKLLGDIDQSMFGRDTPYQIMFGPQMCRIRWETLVAFTHPLSHEILHIKDKMRIMPDHLTHLYTLVVKPDNTFEVLIDLEPVKSGTLADNWDFPSSRLPKTTNLDGSPVNESSEVAANTEELYVRCINCTHIGLEFWHHSAGTLFDDIIVTDSLEEAKAYAQESFLKKQETEEKYEVMPLRKIIISSGARDIDGRRELIVTPRYDVPKNLPQMDSATVSKLDRNAKAKAGVPNIQITNPLNGASIQWAPSINAGSEHNVMDSRTASMLGLKPGYDCTEGYCKGWLSVIELSVLGKSVETPVCVSNSDNNILGRPLLETYDLCHSPVRGVVECSAAVSVF